MDNQNDYMVSSREEYIRLARESCIKNLGNSHGDMDVSKKNKVNILGSPYSYDKNEYGKESYLIAREKMNFNQPWVKRLLIRTICALVLFLSIYAIDRLNFTYKELNSQSIETIVTTSRGFDATEDYFVNLFKNIMKVDKEAVDE